MIEFFKDTKTPTLPSERWLPVPGWDGILYASSLGRVRVEGRFTKTKPGRKKPYMRWVDGRIAIQYLNNSGYLFVVVNSRSLFVHRLVCSAFHGVIPDSFVVNHINHVKSDNRALNLESITLAENRMACINFHKQYGEGHPGSKLTEAQVELICTRLWRGDTQKDIALSFNVSRQTIGLIYSGKVWGHLKCVKSLKSVRTRDSRTATVKHVKSRAVEVINCKIKVAHAAAHGCWLKTKSLFV